MNEIFARAGVGHPGPGVRRPAAVTALRPSRGGSPSVTVLIAVVAGLVGLGAGAFVIRTPPGQGQSGPKTAAQPEPRPAPATPPVALADAVAAPEAQVPPTQVQPAQVQPAAKAQSARIKSTAPRLRLRPRFASATPAEAMPPIRLPVPTAQPARCQRDIESDECHRAVLQADRHLRAVYESAIRRGVARSTLVDYRDRWEDLRDRDTDNPTRLIENYGALAYDLGREHASVDDEDDAPRPHGRSGLKALADLLLPWR